MRERQLLVDPGPARQAARVQLARREHDLPVLAVDDVAVVVDRDEVVVRPDLLHLAEGVEQRLIVPERNVLDRRRVALEVAPRQPCISRERPLLHAIEPERVARRADVVHDVRRFPHLLVRRDDEALDDARIDAAANRHDDVEGEGPDDGQEACGDGLIDGESRADERRDGQQTIGRHARMDVDVRRAEDDARLLREQMRNPEPGAEGQHHEEGGREQRQVPLGGAAGDHASKGVEREVSCGDVGSGDAGEREDDGRQRDPVDELEHRQLEHVERDVAAEHRIGPAERHRVNRIQPGGPRRGRVETDQNRGDERGGIDDRAQASGVDGDDARAVGRRDRELAPPEQAKREPQVEPEDDEYDGADHHAGRRLRGERLEEDLLVAELPVPEPVSVELGE